MKTLRDELAKKYIYDERIDHSFAHGRICAFEAGFDAALNAQAELSADVEKLRAENAKLREVLDKALAAANKFRDGI